MAGRLIRTLLAVIPVCALLAAPAEKGQLDADPSVFTVMAALNAAGFDADIDSPANHPLRQQLREYLKTKKIDCLPELKQFFAAHKQANASAEISQYVSYALSVNGPPDFAYRYTTTELAPDVVPLDGLSPLLTRFYREAGIEQVWEKSQPAIEKVIESYQAPVSRAVMQANAYLRNPTSGYLGRRFQIYIDVLGPPNQVHTRSYKDDYFIVITPSPESQVDEIRHAYLHYLLDPLVLKYSEALYPARQLSDYALDAPALESYYKNDFTLFATECLIKAVEAHLEPAAKRGDAVMTAMREGFVMTPALYDALGVYEKQEQALRLFFPDMVKTIDLRKETARLTNIQFVRERASKKIKVVTSERKVELTPAQKALEDANNLYTARKLDDAKRSYSNLLQMTPDRAIHSWAYYGLARIAALERDPESSARLFERALELNPDAEVKAWSLVYLGRLYDAQKRRDQAEQYYRAVLEFNAAPPAARQAAEKGLKDAFTNKK